MEALVQRLREENEELRRSLAASQAAAVAPTHAVGPRAEESSHVDDTTATSTTADAPGLSLGDTLESDFALEVGYLSLTATGETRYLGNSSGLGLANIITTVLDLQGNEERDQEETSGQSDSPPVRCISATLSDSALPALATARSFIDAYFQHTHISFPLIHRPSFLATVKRIYEDEGFYENNPFDAFVFDMVLAIGSSNFNRFEDSVASSSGHFARANSKLDTVLRMGRLSQLKAILLISQHGIFSNLRDTSGSIWHLVGIGARICIELGLHLERKQPDAANREPFPASIVLFEEEMKKRCFWSLYNLDRVVSFTLGRPVAIRDEEVDVSLPSHLDDDQFGPDRPIFVQPQVDGVPRNDSPFLHITRIRRLSGRILTQLYNLRHSNQGSVADKRATRRMFHAEINAWRNDTGLLGLSANASNGGYLSSFVSPDWYKVVYSNALLLLYRPSPLFPHPSATPNSDAGKSDLLELLHAAEASIQSYSELHRKRRLNYSWITLHGVFIAGLSYVYSVGRILRSPSTCSLSPDVFSIVEVTRACSNVLVAICERWNASRRSCELFNKLSSAVTRDALNATSKRSGNPQSQTGSCAAVPTPKSGTVTALLPQGAEMMALDSSMDDSGSAGLVQQWDDMLVMSEFRDIFGSVDAMQHVEGSLPSELLSSFSQAWNFDTPHAAEADPDDPGEGNGIISWDLGTDA
ncbi:hypothetical protein NW759_010466 [Fusarium solani]|nr:hypothetical protein NW759_010466 [Fusarium solani]